MSNILNNKKIKNTFLTIYMIINILLIKHIFVGFMVSEIQRLSVFGYFPLLIFLNNTSDLVRFYVITLI